MNTVTQSHDHQWRRRTADARRKEPAICIINHFPANIVIDEAAVTEGACSNPDGFGWSVAQGDLLVVDKSMNFDVAFKAFTEARAELGADSIATFHSRIATAGSVDEYGCHPFYVGGTDTVLFHNGILPKQFQPTGFDQRSDTRIFADTVLPSYLTANGIPSRRGGKQLANLIGTGSKLLIVSVASGEPKVRIVNSHLGVNDGGAWHSNTSYLPTRWPAWSSKYEWTGSSSYKNWWETNEENMEAKASEGKWWAEQEWAASKCDVCLGHAVNLDTNVCDDCHTCLDCWENIEHCECTYAEAVVVDA